MSGRVGTGPTQRSDSRARLIGIGLMACVALAWAGIEWLGAKASGYSPYQVVWTRYGTHLLLMVVVLGPRQKGRLWRTSRPGLQIFRSLLMLVMPVCFIMAAQHYLEMKFLWAITWTSVPMMMGLAAAFLGERVTLESWLLAGAGLGGTWLVLDPSLPQPGLAPGLALLVAFSFGGYVVLTRLLRAEYTGANLFHTALWVFLALSMYVPRVWQTPTLPALAVMVGIGIAGFLVLLLIDLALAKAPVALLAPFLCTECLWIAAFNTRRPSLGLGTMGRAGAVLIASSCAWIFWREWRAARAQANL